MHNLLRVFQKVFAEGAVFKTKQFVKAWEVQLLGYLTSGLLQIEFDQVLKLKDMDGMTLVVLAEVE